MEADRRADKEGTSSDRHEPISLMEPMLISESSRFRNGLADLAVEIAARSAGFRRSLPRGIVAALADLVRSMNCYYSNLIEPRYSPDRYRACLKRTTTARMSGSEI
jgi:hypothetical protein